QELLEHLHAVHSIFPVLERLGQHVKSGQSILDTQGSEAVHPVVKVHPETGRKAIYVNAAWTTRIVELNPTESTRMLEFLFDHVRRPDFGMRWHWQPGDVAVCDNRAVQHYAVSDYNTRRAMYRALVWPETSVS